MQRHRGMKYAAHLGNSKQFLADVWMNTVSDEGGNDGGAGEPRSLHALPVGLEFYLAGS